MEMIIYEQKTWISKIFKQNIKLNEASKCHMKVCSKMNMNFKIN